MLSTMQNLGLMTLTAWAISFADEEWLIVLDGQDPGTYRRKHN
jgi:hypothetical protein